MAPNPAVDLTTIEKARAFLRLSTESMSTDEADLLQRIITEKSKQAAGIADCAFIAATYTAEPYDGNGKTGFCPLHAPIVSVTTLSVDGVAIPASVAGADGYVINADRTRLQLIGYTLTEGVGNVLLTYRAGYEPGTIPADVEGAVLNLVGLAWKGLDRIGQTFKNMDGVTVDFRGSTEFADAMRTLKAYRREVI